MSSWECPIVTTRGARNLTYLIDMSRFLCPVFLALRRLLRFLRDSLSDCGQYTLLACQAKLLFLLKDGLYGAIMQA